MALRKHIENEQLNKVVVFEIQRLSKDLTVTNTILEKFQKNISGQLEETYNRKVEINIDTFNYANRKFNNELESKLEEQKSFLSRFEKDIFKTVKESADALESKNNELKTPNRAINLFYVNIGIMFVSIFLLHLAYSIGFENKSDIREEYKNELIKNGQYNSKENAIFLDKFDKWIQKNPKDSKKLFIEIQKF